METERDTNDTLADVNTAMRERVTHLERRYGRKRVYVVAGVVALLVVLLTIRAITSRHKQPRRRRLDPWQWQK